jgi:DNA-binding transcriptional LysR family regulator
LFLELLNMTTLIEKTAGLLAFVRSVEAGSFSKAARSMGATPSAISKSVAKLEARLGVRLLQRSTRSLSLTNEGAAYYERVARLVRELEEADASVHGSTLPRGSLRVSAPIDLGRLVLARLAGQFVDRFPNVRLELLLTDRNVDLVREGIDVAVRVGPLADSNLIARTLGRTQFIVCAAPSYLKAHGTPANLEDLGHHNCLRYLSSGRPLDWEFLEEDGPKTVSVSGSFDTDDGGALVAAACAGAGIAYFFRFQGEAHFSTRQLIPILEQYTTPSLEIHALHAYSRHVSPRVRAWIDFLRERLSDHDVLPGSVSRSVEKRKRVVNPVRSKRLWAASGSR